VSLSLILFLTTSGCALTRCGAEHESAGATDARFLSEANQRAAEAPTETSPIFRVLAAEYYGRHKEYDRAAEYYASVASESDNVALIERAIQVAIFADRFDLVQLLAGRLESIDPSNPRAAAVMLIAALELDQTDRADSALNKWLEYDTANAGQIFNETGQYLQRSLDPDKALAYTRHLAERFPNQVDAQIMVAKLALSFGDADLARQAADRVLELRPDSPLSYDLTMLAANRQGDIDRALEVLEQAHARFPDKTRYLGGLIDAYLITGRKERATALVREALAAEHQEPETLRRLALAAYELDRRDLSDRALDRLSRIPGHADTAHLIRGRFALRDGDLRAAKRALAQISAESDQYANAQTLIAGMRVNAGKDESAVEGLRAALREEAIDEADRQQLTLALASTLAEIGRFERSLEVANQALEAWPEANDFRLQKAMTLFALDQADMAKGVLRTIIERDPEHAPALNALGYTLADENRDLDEAERLIGRALQIDPDNPAYLDSLGWLQYRKGKPREARATLESAFHQAPNAEIGAHLGEVLWALGEHEQAIAIWQEAIELDPQHDTLLETVRRFAPELLPAGD
jgi:tetratricopeptide (TPR) repeat protein